MIFSNKIFTEKHETERVSSKENTIFNPNKG